MLENRALKDSVFADPGGVISGCEKALNIPPAPCLSFIQKTHDTGNPNDPSKPVK
jgi:hypothetical protein